MKKIKLSENMKTALFLIGLFSALPIISGVLLVILLCVI